jgi:hypothetical protein
MAASPGKHPERRGVTVQLARAGRNNPLFRGAARARPTALWKDSSPRAALRRKSGGGGRPRKSTTVNILFFTPLPARVEIIRKLIGESHLGHRREVSFPLKGTLALHCQVATAPVRVRS